MYEDSRVSKFFCRYISKFIANIMQGALMIKEHKHVLIKVDMWTDSLIKRQRQTFIIFLFRKKRKKNIIN